MSWCFLPSQLSEVFKKLATFSEFSLQVHLVIPFVDCTRIRHIHRIKLAAHEIGLVASVE